MKEKESSEANPLWTRDFTIITLGSVISMFGNAIAGFAMGLMVLDYTGSTFLYAVYISMYTIPQLVIPLFSGAILDRFSRKKMIYTLDFISSGIYAAVGLLLMTGWFSFPFFAIFCFIVGSISSIYMVAYQSFYPLTISEGNYSKAYSIASVLETMSAVMVPVSVWLYKQIGLGPLILVNAVCFLAAAIVETQIRTEETYIDKQKEELAAKGEQLSSGKLMFRDIKEGFSYLRGEKGLLMIAIFFTFSSFASGASSVITLPWFKATYQNGEYQYMLVWGMCLIGRMIGGAIHYRKKLPVSRKYIIALSVYIIIGLLEGFYLFLPVKLMMVFCFFIGLGGVTSYTIRISATQSYVPDEKKGRFNGAFQILNTFGMLVAELLTGILAEFFPHRTVLMIFELITVAAAIVFIGGNRKSVAEIYNREK